MKTRVLAVAVAMAVLACLATPVAAEKGDKRLRFGALYAMPMDDLKGTGETTELDDATGFLVGFEFMVTELIGVEPAISMSSHDVEVDPAGAPEFTLGEIDFMALTASVNCHLLHKKENSKVDLFVGPTVGYALWDDLEVDLFGLKETVGTDDELILGVNLGLDVPSDSQRWAFYFGLTYLFAEISLEPGAGATSSRDLGVDPLQVKVGASVKF